MGGINLNPAGKAEGELKNLPASATTTEPQFALPTTPSPYDRFRIIVYVARPTATSVSSSARTSTCTNENDRLLRNTCDSATTRPVAAARNVTFISVVA